jgi:hypothetical protein
MVLLMSAPRAARADIAMTGSIVYWNQYGQTGSQTATPGTGSAYIQAIDMTRGSGLGANAGSNSLNSKGWTSEATDYVEFGFTVSQGYEALLDKLYFATKVSSTGPTSLIIKTSADGFASTFNTIAQVNDGSTYTNKAIDLSGLGPIAGGTTFTIRFYGDGASSANGTMRICDYYDGGYYYDSITGIVTAQASPAPLPGAVWLLGSGIVGLLGFRKKFAL